MYYRCVFLSLVSMSNVFCPLCSIIMLHIRLLCAYLLTYLNGRPNWRSYVTSLWAALTRRSRTNPVQACTDCPSLSPGKGSEVPVLCGMLHYIGCHQSSASSFWLVAWHSGRTSVLAGELSLLHARPSADGWPLMWVNRPLEVRLSFWGR